MKKPQQARRDAGMGRREFLVLSSTCALGALTLGPKMLADTVAPGRSVAPKSLAVGFASLDGPMGAYLNDAFGVPFAQADSIPSPDGMFIRTGVRVKIGQVSAGANGWRWINAICPEFVVDGAGRVPVYAWGYNRGTNQGGSVSSFRIPLEDDQMVRIQVRGANPPAGRSRPATPAASVSQELAFTTLSDPNALKLRRGYYGIVPLFDGDKQPAWDQLIVRDASLVLHAKGDNGPLFDREHVVLRIDYAEQP